MANKEPYKGLVIAASIAIPVLVATLFRVRLPGYNFSFLPPIYASINALTAVLLLTAHRAIKRGRQRTHRRLMETCLVLSLSFLVMYVLYHMTSDPTPYGGSGILKYVYFFILITHILLSALIVPLVLFTYVRALGKNFDRHKALAKFAYPAWLYVAVTGVIVYLMISPYYT